MKLDLDELPTVWERTLDYIHALKHKEVISGGIVTTLTCLLGMVLFSVIRRKAQKRNEPKFEQWENDNGLLRKVAIKQSKVMSKPNVKETTTYVNCIN